MTARRAGLERERGKFLPRNRKHKRDRMSFHPGWDPGMGMMGPAPGLGVPEQRGLG